MVANLGHKGAFGVLPFKLEALLRGPNNLSHLFGHSRPPEMFL